MWPGAQNDRSIVVDWEGAAPNRFLLQIDQSGPARLAVQQDPGYRGDARDVPEPEDQGLAVLRFLACAQHQRVVTMEPDKARLGWAGCMMSVRDRPVERRKVRLRGAKCT